MLLLIDAGNTDIKFASCVNNTLAVLPSCPSSVNSETLVSHIQHFNPGKLARIGITSTLDRPHVNELLDALKTNWPQADIHFVYTHPGISQIQHCYQEPDKLGSDRWLAMLAVITQYQSPALVIDMGTVLTADMLDGNRHLGGWMIPGLAKMQDSLLNTAGIAKGTQQKPDTVNNDVYTSDIAFGQSTTEGVHAGITAAVLGSIEQAISLARQKLGRSFTLYMTGGDSDKFVTMLSMPATHIPNLVFEGLAWVTQHHHQLFNSAAPNPASLEPDPG